MKIWIYWFESNAWIYFYIVLNKTWKIHLSEQNGFRNDSAGEGFDNENAGDGFAEAKYFSNSSSSTLISSNFCAKVLLGALREWWLDFL
jgi:hypothetical protein